MGGEQRCQSQSGCFSNLSTKLENFLALPRKTCAFKNLHKEQYITIIICERRLTFKEHELEEKRVGNDSMAWQKELNLCLLHPWTRGERVEI
jgi:hypothetical protein